MMFGFGFGEGNTDIVHLTLDVEIITILRALNIFTTKKTSMKSIH
jgi:hypothetical protein